MRCHGNWKATTKNNKTADAAAAASNVVQGFTLVLSENLSFLSKMHRLSQERRDSVGTISMEAFSVSGTARKLNSGSSTVRKLVGAFLKTGRDRGLRPGLVTSLPSKDDSEARQAAAGGFTGKLIQDEPKFAQGVGDWHRGRQSL